jgi:PKD repeat protein
VTLPPTGTFAPGATDEATPRPSKKPPASIAPATPAPTSSPTPEVTPEITPPPEPPVAAFSWSAVLLVVSFADESTGATSWQWDFGDGTGASAANPDHVYAVPGDYAVRLTVSGPGGTDFVEKTVSVVSP